MTPYLDGGFLLTLLVKTQGTSVASRVLREIPAPVPIHVLRQLQAENLLVRLQKSGQTKLRIGGSQAQRLWRNYLAAGVFVLAPADWDGAFRTALTWNSLSPQIPPAPLLLLHPALALTGGASHFANFDPRGRALARAHGLKLLPARI